MSWGEYIFGIEACKAKKSILKFTPKNSSYLTIDFQKEITWCVKKLTHFAAKKVCFFSWKRPSLVLTYTVKYNCNFKVKNICVYILRSTFFLKINYLHYNKYIYMRAYVGGYYVLISIIYFCSIYFIFVYVNK